tara:strand:+ start:7548 stop:10121 length:2574 start_codon:yes stop_codon:yes gene_type:complete
MLQLVDKLQTRVSEWRDNGYPDIYPETKNIIRHIKHRNYLHTPQREAFETYVYLKEIEKNRPLSEIAQELFATDGEMYEFLKELGFTDSEIGRGDKKTMLVEEAKKKFGDFGYANYLFALTMGAGKTVLMGTLLMYEFIISKYHEDDERFAKNLLVLGPPDTTIVEVLKEIKTFDYSTVIPKEYEDIMLAIKWHYLDDPKTPLQPIGTNNVIVSNSSKVIKKNWKEEFRNRLFELRNDPVNHRLRAIQKLENLAVFVDEAHHAFGKNIEKAINQSRDTINHLAEQTNVVTVVNMTGTPYINKKMIPDTVYYYGLKEGIEHGILKQVDVKGYGNVRSQEFVDEVVDAFVDEYDGKRVEGKLLKIAFYAPNTTDAFDELSDNLDRALRRHNIPLSRKLLFHSNLKNGEYKQARHEFENLDTPESEKQFILLVGKGTEGWNCKSLASVALYRSPSSNNFVLQSTSRCLRRLGDNSTVATVFLSDDSYDILDKELKQSFNIAVSDISGIRSNTVVIDIEERKPKVLTINKRERILAKSSKKSPDSIKIKLTVGSKEVERTVKESGITLVDGKAVYSDPTDITSSTSKKRSHARDFGFYDVVGHICERTHISYSELRDILKSNKVTQDQLVKAVNKNYAVVYSIVDQILDQYYEYEYENREYQQSVALTKDYPLKINVDKDKAQTLVVYKEQEEQDRGASRIGFHIDPYDFTKSTDELEVFRYLRPKLNTDEDITDVYFTGSVTSEAHNEFFVDYYNPEEKRMARYFPDFLVETTKGRYLVVEVKGKDKETNYKANKVSYQKGKKQKKKDEELLHDEVFAKEVGFNEFQQLNQNFDYHIIFNSKDEKRKRELVQAIATTKNT